MGQGQPLFPELEHRNGIPGENCKESKDKICPDKLWLPLDAGSVQDQAGQILEQADPVEDVPVSELELGNL